MSDQLTLGEALDMIEWYCRCLEDVQDGRPVRGLDEAKRGYDRALWQLKGAPGFIVISGEPAAEDAS